jgi:hypothetical protein
VALGSVLAGKVMSKDGGPLVFQDAGVLLIPENLATGGKQAMPEYLWHGVDSDGSYRVENIRPGKYRLLAVDERERDKWLDEEDPAALLKLAAGGEEIEFQPGDRNTKNLKTSEKGESDAQPIQQQ